MITYQVDQNTNSKRLVESCKKQGLVDVRRFPQRLSDKDDPDVLAEAFSSDRTLLTMDREIHFGNAVHFPTQHSGILIVANASSPRTITIADMVRTLAQLKSSFPDWHQSSLRNSVVELTERSVEVWRVDNGAVLKTAFISFEQPDWQHELAKVLQCNASVGAIEEP